MTTLPARLAGSLLAVLLGTAAAPAQIEVELCLDEKTRDHVRALVLEGIDQALVAQTVKLFDVWQRDVNENPPQRALAGFALATKAYFRARDRALKWNPPLCPS